MTVEEAIAILDEDVALAESGGDPTHPTITLIQAYRILRTAYEEREADSKRWDTAVRLFNERKIAPVIGAAMADGISLADSMDVFDAALSGRDTNT